MQRFSYFHILADDKDIVSVTVRSGESLTTEANLQETKELLAKKKVVTEKVEKLRTLFDLIKGVVGIAGDVRSVSLMCISKAYTFAKVSSAVTATLSVLNKLLEVRLLRDWRCFDVLTVCSGLREPEGDARCCDRTS